MRRTLVRSLPPACVLLLCAVGCGLWGKGKTPAGQGQASSAASASASSAGSAASASSAGAASASSAAAASEAPARYVDGVDRSLPAKYAADKALSRALGRLQRYRREAREQLAERLGLVLTNPRRQIYLRFASRRREDAQRCAPEVAFGRAERLVVDGAERPLVTLYPEAIKSEQVTLREALCFELTRAALLDRLDARYYRLPRWFRLGLAYHGADRSATLLARALVDRFPDARPLRALVARPAAGASRGWVEDAVWGSLWLSQLERAHGPAKLKQLIALTTRADDPLPIGAAVERVSGQPLAELERAARALGERLIGELGGAQPAFRQALAVTYLEQQNVAGMIRALQPLAAQPTEGELADALGNLAAGPVSYWVGRGHHQLGQHERAAQALASLRLNHARTSPLLDRAMLWEARSLAAARRQREALTRLQRLLTDFPESAIRDQALLERGLLLVALERPDSARQAFAALLAEQPKGRSADRARLALVELALARGALVPAAEQLAALAERPLGAKEAARRDALAQQLAERQQAPAPRELIDEIAQRVDELGRGAQRDAARRRLRELGKPAVDPLGRALGRAEAAIRLELAALLGQLGEPEAGPYLIAQLAKGQRGERVALLRALLQVGVTPEALPEQLTAAGLAAGVQRELTAQLRQLIRGASLALRQRIPRLAGLLVSTDAAPRRRAAELINRAQHPDGVPVLATLLADPSLAVRREAMQGLVVWGDARALPALLVAADDPDAGLRAEALAQLARYRHPPAAPVAARRARDPEPRVRAAALGALAAIRGRAAFVPLDAGLADPSDSVRTAAGAAILAVAGQDDTARRAIVRQLIPRCEQQQDKLAIARYLELLSRLTGLELRAVPQMTRPQLVSRLDRARLWLANPR